MGGGTPWQQGIVGIGRGGTPWQKGLEGIGGRGGTPEIKRLDSEGVWWEGRFLPERKHLVVIGPAIATLSIYIYIYYSLSENNSMKKNSLHIACT